MNDQRSGTEPRLQVGGVTVDPRQPPARRGTHAGSEHWQAAAADGATEADRVEAAEPVGQQRDTGADFAEPRGPFEDRDLPADLPQGHGRGEPAYPAAHHDRRLTSHHLAPCPLTTTAAFPGCVPP